MTDFMRGKAQDVDVGLRGYASLNNSIKTQPVKSAFTLTPDQVDPARDVTHGNQSTPVTFVAAKGGYELTGQEAALETARLARYRPGGLQIAGQMVIVDSVPTEGQLEMGLGRITDGANFTKGGSEIFLRLNSDGDYALVFKRDGTETIIPRDGPGGSWTGAVSNRSWDPDTHQGTEVDDEDGDLSGRIWGIDTFDGEGGDSNPTKLDIDPPTVLLVKLTGTFYGKGPYFLGFEAVGPGGYQRDWPAVAFETAEQSILNQPNQPVMARYDDGGAGNTETFEVYGRQASFTGDFEDTPFTPFHYEGGLSWSGPTKPITGTDLDGADLVLAYRRRPDSDTTADSAFAGVNFGLLELDADISHTSFFFLSLDPDFGSQTPAWEVANGVNNPDLSPIQIATQDGGGSALTADASTGRRFGGEKFGDGKNTKRVGELDPVDQPTPRNKAVGIFALSTTETAESDGEVVPKFQVVQ